MKNLSICIGVILVLFLGTVATFAQEVPSAKSAAAKTAIKKYVEQDRALKGAFLIKDANAAAVRELSFDYVHDTVHKTEDGRYYACVDFKQQEKVLDVDFYLKETPDGKFEVAEIVIHKIDGKEVKKQ